MGRPYRRYDSPICTYLPQPAGTLTDTLYTYFNSASLIDDPSNAAQQDIFVEREMPSHVYTNTPDFLRVLFTGSDVYCREVLRHLQSLGLWIPLENDAAAGHWAHMKPKPSTEEVLYAPFVDIGNAVMAFVTSKESERILRWTDCHAIAPESQFNNQNKLFPDIAVRLLKRQTNGAKELNQLLWQQVVLVAEFTKRTRKKPALFHLMVHIRRTFKNQLDRRYIFGFLFTYEYLQVWLFDRSGALGSHHINVHKEPLLFIQFFVSLAQKSPTELGFDPTFRMRSPNGLVNSYAVESSSSFSKDHPLWEFEMVLDGGGTQRFIAFRRVSINRSEIACGRATRVWLVWLGSEVDARVPIELRQVLVLKDHWQEERRVAEGILYRSQGPLDGIAKLFSFGDIHIDGVSDSTRAARCDLAVHGLPLSSTVSTTNKIGAIIRDRYNDSFRKDSGLCLNTFEEMRPWIDVVETEKVVHPVYPRVHSRIVLQSFGFPLVDFKDLVELLTVLKDAINGHKNLVDSNYLHRDISRGNIVIAPGGTSGNVGLLIDQDYTIPYPGHTPLDGDHRSGTLAFMATEILEQTFLYPSETNEFDPTLIDALMRRIENQNHSVSTPDADVSSVLDAYSNRYIVHQPIHDLESFFWVLCCLCMTRSGPGTPRIPHERNGPDDQALSAARALFQSTPFASASYKRSVITDNVYFVPRLVLHFAPYFAPLVPLVFALREYLRTAYQTKVFTDVHSKFVAAIDEALKRVTKDPSPKVPGLEGMLREVSRKRAEHGVPFSSPWRPEVFQEDERSDTE